MSSEYTDIIGDDTVFYSPSATDQLVSDANLMYRDFEEWLDECETADAVFDSVISPYFKGNPPPDKRMKKKRPEYDSAILDAKNTFDATLEEIINYIIDYSNNSSLMIPEEVSVGSADMVTTERFVVEDEILTEETVIIGETNADGDEVMK